MDEATFVMEAEHADGTSFTEEEYSALMNKLMKDSARLDWLTETHLAVEYHSNSEGTWWRIGNYIDGTEYEGESLRDAIDAARKA